MCMLSRPAECHVFVFLICKMSETHISQRCAKNDTCPPPPPFAFLDSTASVCHIETISRDRTCVAKYQMSHSRGSCAAAQWKSLYCIMFPHASDAALWRKQFQLLSAIDPFVVPLCWTAIACSRSLQWLLVHFVFCLPGKFLPHSLSRSNVKAERLIISLEMSVKCKYVTKETE